MPELARLRAAGTCAALLICGPIATAQPVESAPEHSIKAAYLYNFATYVDWPPEALGDADPVFVVGVLGAARVAGYMAAMTAGREVHGRPIEVRQVASGDSVDSLHMLFIAADSAGALPRLRDAAREHSVLVVTEWEGALDSGSIINFRLIDQRIRFEVSLAAADRCGLSISSRMLSVAQRVLPRSGE
ncbi:MAG TPA: YfiR family protein [Woeseiaceae bacterium]|nr:YfiR family protein [Woeseiaceae bacterium]